MDHGADGPAGPDGDGRLHVEIARGDAVAGARRILLGRFAQRPNQIAFVAAEAELGPDAEQGRERDALQEPPGMEVDLVLKARIAGKVRRRHVVEADRGSVRKDDPLPDQHRATLAVGDDAVVAPDQTRALRNQHHAPGRAVAHILGHLREHGAGKIGVEAGDQAGRDQSSGAQRPGRGGRPQDMGIGVARLRPPEFAPSLLRGRGRRRLRGRGAFRSRRLRLRAAGGLHGRAAAGELHDHARGPRRLLRGRAALALRLGRVARAIGLGHCRRPGVGCRRLQAALMLKDRPAEVAGERRPEPGNLPVAGRGVGECLRRALAERVAGRLLAGRETEARRIERHPGDGDQAAGDRGGHADDEAAPEPDHRAGAAAQHQGLRIFLRRGRGRIA